jgi:hypothetical protein
MKICCKILALSIVTLIVVNLAAQPSVEANYLAHINQQHDLFLIRDNIPSAEFAAMNILLEADQSSNASLFFEHLAVSFDMLDMYSNSLYYTLVNLWLYPENSTLILEKAVYLERAYRIGLDRSEALEIYTHCMHEKSSDIKRRMNALLKYSIQHVSDVCYDEIYFLGDMYYHQFHETPVYFQHWRLLTMINMPQNDMLSLLDFSETARPAYFSTDNQLLTAKVFRRAIRYYYRTDADAYADELATMYKARYPGVHSAMFVLMQKTLR